MSDPTTERAPAIQQVLARDLVEGDLVVSRRGTEAPVVSAIRQSADRIDLVTDHGGLRVSIPCHPGAVWDVRRNDADSGSP